MMTLLHVQMHYGHVFLLPRQRLARLAADDDFVIQASMLQSLFP